MKHHYKPSNNQSTKWFTDNHRIFRCDGNCFQKSFYQYPSYICHPISNIRVPPCSVVPINCNPLFNYPYYQPGYFKNIKTKQKLLNPCASQVMVRQTTPLHRTFDTSDTYRTDRYQHSERIHRITTSSNSKIQITDNTSLFENDSLDCDNKNIPSVPSKKIVRKNNGLRVSSTSFIITIDDPKSFSSTDVSENSLEHHITSVQTYDDSLITEQTESKRNNIDEKYSIKDQASQIELSHRDMISELSTIKSPSIDMSNRPTLPSSSPPDINRIKSSEFPIKSSRSVKSISSLRNIRVKSSTDLTKSNPSLRTIRSTLDFGLLIDEILTEHS